MRPFDRRTESVQLGSALPFARRVKFVPFVLSVDVFIMHYLVLFPLTISSFFAPPQFALGLSVFSIVRMSVSVPTIYDDFWYCLQLLCRRL